MKNNPNGSEDKLQVKILETSDGAEIKPEVSTCMLTVQNRKPEIFYTGDLMIDCRQSDRVVELALQRDESSKNLKVKYMLVLQKCDGKS